jgi:hypothetical protein
MFEEQFLTKVILNAGAHFQSNHTPSTNAKQALHQIKERQELHKENQNHTC